MTHHLWIFDFRNTAWLSIFSGDIQLVRVHSSRTNIREAFAPCGRKAGWLWVKPTVGETAALHLFGNQTRHFCSSYEHPPNRVRVPTLFKVARESTEWGVRHGPFGAWTSVPAQPFPYSKTWSPLSLSRWSLSYLSVLTFSDWLIILVTALQYEEPQWPPPQLLKTSLPHLPS